MLIAALPLAVLKPDFLITAVLTLLAGLALGLASFNWASVIAGSSRSSYFLPLAVPAREIAALLAVTGGFVLSRGERDATRAGVFLGVGWCLAWLLLVRAAAVVAPIYSGVELAAAWPALERDAPLYSIATYDQSLTFYLRRTATLVRYRGELDYGLKKAPQRQIADIEEFLPLWSSQTRAFAVMETSMFDRLEMQGVPMRVIGRNAGKVLVSRL
jgi:hypothetical protein